MITKYFPSQNVIIIAHSMGGLVAHSYIQNHNGGSKVNKLITLATPYHGSQLVQLGVGALDVVAKVSFNNILLVMGTFGSHDLAWDNYPNATKDDNTNASLFDLNNTLSTSQYASLYNAFAGSNLDSSHSYYDVSYGYLYVLGYESDGVVPLVSAYNYGYPQGFVPKDYPDGEKNYDHSEMTGKNSTDQLFDTIKKILPIYNISGTVTYNGAGLAGVTVTLTGTSPSSTTTTDSNGNFSFSYAANGTYILTPSMTGYTFSPTSSSIKVNSANLIGQNFTATVGSTGYTISGQVTYNGTGLAGVTVTLTGTGLSSTLTDANGWYKFTNAANGSYNLSFSGTGYTFNPSSVSVQVNGANFTVATNIVATAVASVTISLPKTGQTTCYDASGSVISCAGTGQDGELQKGVAWPDPRFTDNGDETQTDRLTGLIWTKDANAPGPAACDPGKAKFWYNALDYVQCLNTNNYLNHSDWRLPNRNELASLVNAGQSNLANWLNAQGFTNVQAYQYWSSSTSFNNTSEGWVVYMDDENMVTSRSKTDSDYVWPVRDRE
jgi:hypothetical protein